MAGPSATAPRGLVTDELDRRVVVGPLGDREAEGDGFTELSASDVPGVLKLTRREVAPDDFPEPVHRGT